MSQTNTQGTGSQQAAENAAEHALERVARGQDLTAQEEHEALEFLLGATTALEYEVPVTLETDRGPRPLRARIRQVDDTVFQRADEANRAGDGPFGGKLNVTGFNAAVLEKALIALNDQPVDTERFVGGHPKGLQGAITLRFKNQPGLLDTLVDRVREVSGYKQDRVGKAQRVLVEAGKPS